MLINQFLRLDQEHNATCRQIVTGKRYIGEQCKLESCKHNSDLYMYKLNNGVVSEELVFSNPIVEDLASNRENEEWNNKTPEERHEYIKNLKKNLVCNELDLHKNISNTNNCKK